MTEDNRAYLSMDGTVVDGGDALARAERTLYMTTGTWNILAAKKPPQFVCPVHGTVSAILDISIPGIEGAWCLRCLRDLLEKLGIQRLSALTVASAASNNASEPAASRNYKKEDSA